MTGTGTWRKTRQGEWVVMAAPAILSPGRAVTVLARSGETKQVTVARVGKTFMTADGPRAYGYIGQTSTQTRRECDGRCGCHHGRWSNFDGCTRCGCDGDM